MKKKYEIVLRSRPVLDETILEKHYKFLSYQSKISTPWTVSENENCLPKEKKGYLSTTVSLTKCLGKGLKGQVVYSFRSKEYLKDHAMFDDVLAVEFDPNRLDYSILSLDVFSKLVEAFGCYRAAVYDSEIALSDWGEVKRLANETHQNVDGRDGIYRIHPVSFFDRELSMRAFGKAPSEIVSRLQGKVEHVCEWKGGVLLIYSSKVLDEGAYLEVDSAVRKLLQ